MQSWPTRTSKPAREEFEHTTTFVKQLVRLVTAAKRAGRGDWVWVSWNGDEKWKAIPRPQHACTFFAVSHEGAVRLKDKFWTQCDRSHFDLSMKWLFEKFAKELRASFVFPTIGHYSTHDSDILNTTRKSEWDRWYVGDGQTPVQLWSWEALPSGRSQPYQLLLFDFPKEQPQFDWLTYYHESATPQVELVATCKAPSSNKIKKEKTPWKHRTQEEMEIEEQPGSECSLARDGP